MAERSKAVLKRVSGHFKSRIKFSKSSPSAVPGATPVYFTFHLSRPVDHFGCMLSSRRKPLVVTGANRTRLY